MPRLRIALRRGRAAARGAQPSLATFRRKNRRPLTSETPGAHQADWCRVVRPGIDSRALCCLLVTELPLWLDNPPSVAYLNLKYG